MVRNLSSTPVEVLAEGCSGVEALAAGGDAMSVSPSSNEVGPSGSTSGRFVRCPAESRAGWPGTVGDGEPGGECGKGKGARIRDISPISLTHKVLMHLLKLSLPFIMVLFTHAYLILIYVIY